MKHIVVMMLLAGTLVGCAADPATPWLVQREVSKPKIVSRSPAIKNWCLACRKIWLTQVVCMRP